jgi:hypothetical protein
MSLGPDFDGFGAGRSFDAYSSELLEGDPILNF